MSGRALTESIADWAQTLEPDVVKVVVGTMDGPAGTDSQSLITSTAPGNVDQVERDRWAIRFAERCARITTDWAETERRDIAFIAQALNEFGDVVVAHHWRCGPMEAPRGNAFDGSVGSILSQMQQDKHVLMRVHLEGLTTAQRMWTEGFAHMQARIRQLEKENAELRGASVGELDLVAMEHASEQERTDKLLHTGMELIRLLKRGSSKEPAPEAPTEPSPEGAE